MLLGCMKGYFSRVCYYGVGMFLGCVRGGCYGSTLSFSSTQSAGLFEFTTVIRSRSKLRPAAINLAGVPVEDEESSSSSSTETKEGSFFNSSLTAMIVANNIRFSLARN